MIESEENTEFHRYIKDNYSKPENGYNFNYMKGLKKIWEHKEVEIAKLKELINLIGDNSIMKYEASLALEKFNENEGRLRK